MLDEVKTLSQFTRLDLVSGSSSERGASQSTTRLSVEVKDPRFLLLYREGGTWEIAF